MPKTIRVFCPKCLGNTKKKMNSKTGKIIPCSLCRGKGIIYKTIEEPKKYTLGAIAKLIFSDN